MLSVPSRSGFDLFFSHLRVSSVAELCSHQTDPTLRARVPGGEGGEGDGGGNSLVDGSQGGLSFLLISPQLTRSVLTRAVVSV